MSEQQGDCWQKELAAQMQEWLDEVMPKKTRKPKETLIDFNPFVSGLQSSKEPQNANTTPSKLQLKRKRKTEASHDDKFDGQLEEKYGRGESSLSFRSSPLENTPTHPKVHGWTPINKAGDAKVISHSNKDMSKAAAHKEKDCFVGVPLENRVWADANNRDLNTIYKSTLRAIKLLRAHHVNEPDDNTGYKGVSTLLRSIDIGLATENGNDSRSIMQRTCREKGVSKAVLYGLDVLDGWVKTRNNLNVSVNVLRALESAVEALDGWVDEWMLFRD